MAVESKIVYRSDASEVERDTKKLIRARTELVKLQSVGAGGFGGASDKTAGRLQVVREQGAQRRFLQEQRLGAAREARADRAREQHASRLASFKREEMRNEGRLAAIRAREDVKAKRRVAAGPAMGRSVPSSPGGRESVSDALGIGRIAPVAIVGAVAAGGAMFGKAVADAQAFRESTVLAMKAYLGSAAAANTWFDRALALSIELKQNSFDTIEGMTRLRGAGFDDKSVENLTRAFADIKRLAPDADLKSIAARLAQIRATGKLQGDELNELANAWPAARDVIFKQMMKDTGKTQAELQKMQTAGKITPAMVEKALLGGVSALTKMPLGEFAKANADTVRGLIDQVMAIPSQVLLGFDASKDMGRVKSIMKDIVAFFDASSASGKEVRKVVGDTFSAIVEGLFGVDASKGGTKQTLQALLDIIKNSRGDIKEFAGNIRMIVSAVASLLSWISKAKSALGSLRGDEVTGADKGGAAWWISRILPPFPPLLIAQAVQRNWEAIKSAVSAGASAIGDFGMTLWDSGVQLVNGFIGGIMSRISGVVTAATSVASSAAGAVKGFLGIKSPSTRAMGYGRQFNAGFAVGLERFAWMPERAANDVAVSTAAQAHPTLGASTTVNNASVAHTFAPVNSPSIVVGAGASPEAVRAAYEAQAEADADWDRQMERHYSRKANAA